MKPQRVFHEKWWEEVAIKGTGRTVHIPPPESLEDPEGSQLIVTSKSVVSAPSEEKPSSSQQNPAALCTHFLEEFSAASSALDDTEAIENGGLKPI